MASTESANLVFCHVFISCNLLKSISQSYQTGINLKDVDVCFAPLTGYKLDLEVVCVVVYPLAAVLIGSSPPLLLLTLDHPYSPNVLSTR